MSTTVLRSKPPIKRAWWKEATVYQIYPASFKDSNGDGIGDIPGIISKLDYIKSLGVDLVWLSPILQSPQVDMGYDISDYRQIHAPYGTMADHDALIKGLHDRGMKYVMDLVVNHTSDQHEWFKQSRSSKDNPYRDWYYWRPPRYDPVTGERMAPNNWAGVFSTSAWEWDETTQEYYLHLFATEQPDLNWENPAVVKAVHELIRFWLDRGVDGFRMDVINFISKVEGLPDGKITQPGFLQSGAEHFANGPRIHEFFQGIGAILKEYDAFSVGEMPAVKDTAEILRSVGQDRGELAMAFQFEIVDIDRHHLERRPFSKPELKRIVNKWQTFMHENGGWNALYMENHDQGRSISRYCSDTTPQLRTASAKMLASHITFQSGTLFVYQGEELAQKAIPTSWPVSKYLDIQTVNHWKELLRDHPNDTALQDQARASYRIIGRDSARTPIQWTPEAPFAGFMDSNSKAQPWMDIHDDFAEWNAQVLDADPESALNYWRRVLDQRKKFKDLFVYGDFEMLDMDHEEIVAYVRTADDGKKALIITNFGGQAEGIWWTVPEPHAELLFDGQGLRKGAVVKELKNYEGENEVKVENGTRSVHLRPYEALIVMN